MSAYAIYKDLFPPQTVEQVETCHFVSPDATNVIVAKASLLQIYEFVEYVPEQTQSLNEDDDTDLPDQELINERLNENEQLSLEFPKLKPLNQKKDIIDSTSGRLELVAQFKLNGIISTLGAIKTNSPRGREGCDSLLLGFNDAKMSLLEWSPSTNTIVTVSIHYYERDEYKKEFLTNPYPSNIHIDPQQRCAVLNFYDNKLAVLPFRQADKLDERQAENEEEDESQKWPYQSSFIIDLESIDSRIKNVVDMVFLADYYEPTLAILFQPEQTWTGRLASVKDTASVVVISLDLTAKIYPIIYSIDKLPYDCIKLVPMPKPVAGVLVIAANSILHVSQGYPGVGVAVNGYTVKTTEFPGMIYEDKAICLGLSLDGAKALTFGDRCLIFLQNGNWAVVQMKMDGSKIVGMNITEIQEPTSPLATIPSCVTHIKHGEYFFLGSRAGDSLLIKWRYDRNFIFKVCDRLLNTGPILDMAMGDIESNQTPDEDAIIPDLELVSCSGHGKNGSLCVFQRHIHPQTSFSFNQSDCQAIWSIKCRKGSIGSEEDAFDKLLFLSKSKSTMVLSAGDELQELVKTGFYTRGATIAVDTLFDATRIVQVYSTGIMILTPEGKRLRTIPVRSSKIVEATILDPYILLLLDNHKILALQGNPDTKEISSIQLPSSLHRSSISIASLFADTTGLFMTTSEKRAEMASRRANQKKRKATQDHPAHKKPHLDPDVEFDEVDLDLYGEQTEPEPIKIRSDPAEVHLDAEDQMLYGQTNHPAQEIDESNVSLQGTDLTRTTYWCLLYTTDGTLQILSLPDLKELFSFPQFHVAPDLVTDRGEPHKKGTNAIQEILLTMIGKERKDPHLVARTDTHDVILYKAFSYLTQDPDRLAIRFSRLDHQYLSHHEPKPKEIIDEFEIPDLDDDEEEVKVEKRRERLLFPFGDVAGYTGLFVAGPQPAWLLNSCKSFVRVHPMKTERPIVGFTQFHNINCPHGFITVDSDLTVRLSRLRTDGMIYDLDWVMQKIPIGKTVHKIQYHPVMRVYAVIVSSSHPVRVQEDEGEGEVLEDREPGEFLPEVDKFSMIMVSPVTWEIVDTVEFDDFEQCFSLQCASLESKQTSTGLKYFIVVGTGFLKGEDTTMRGSIRIYDIIEVVPEPNNPQTNHKFKHVHTEDVKGAVTAMCNVSGHLVSCIGSKVIVWSLEDDESLVGVAFIDVQIYVTSMSSIKNFILLGDAQKSIWFLGFQLEPAKLLLLGKDYQSFEVGCVDFIIDDKSLYLVVGDTNENLDLYQYAPFNLQSFGGQKLMRRGDFHVGSQVQTMIRLPQIEKTENGIEYSRRHFVLCGTSSGSISILSPISEKTFKRLSTLYGQLVNNVQHVAGLNPRSYRLIKGPKQRMASNRTKAVLDGNLIFEFAGLSIERQKETTKQIGTTVPRIMEDLVDIECSIDHF